MGAFDNIIKILNKSASIIANAPRAAAQSSPPRAPAKVNTPPRAPAKQVSVPGKRNTTTYSAPAKSGTASRTSSSSGSSGGGGSVAPTSFSAGGGGGGGFDGGFTAAAAPVMQDITVPDATEDTDYKRTVADLARALTDFDAQQGLSRKQYDAGYGEARRRMGWNDVEKKFDRSMPGAYGDAVYSNENDFAGRGLTWSGLFGKSFADLNQEFADRGKNLDVARQDNVDTQNLARNTFVNSQDATREAAKQNAISKIMAQFGIGSSDVPVGTGSKVIQRQLV